MHLWVRKSTYKVVSAIEYIFDMNCYRLSSWFHKRKVRGCRDESTLFYLSQKDSLILTGLEEKWEISYARREISHIGGNQSWMCVHHFTGSLRVETKEGLFLRVGLNHPNNIIIIYLKNSTHTKKWKITNHGRKLVVSHLERMVSPVVAFDFIMTGGEEWTTFFTLLGTWSFYREMSL